jgi:hypothetical protein
LVAIARHGSHPRQSSHRRFGRAQAIGGAVALAFAAIAGADEGGTSFWTPGQFASQAAVPTSPGWSLDVTGYAYSGTASLTQPFSNGKLLEFGGRSTTPSLSVQPGYSTEAKLFGGQPFFGLGFGIGGDREVSNLRILGNQTQSSSQTETLWAGSDLYPYASLAWTHENDNWMAYVTGDIPTGAYRASRLSNIGIGHGAVDVGGGYTYYDAKSGIEGSAVLGFTFNFQNPHTSYRNGVDSHLDFAVSRFVTPNWELGAAGYVYYQLTGDSGSGAVLGPFKSRVAALGPELAYQATTGSQWYASVRAYFEFWAKNRFEGYAIFATLNLPFGGAK